MLDTALLPLFSGIPSPEIPGTWASGVRIGFLETVLPLSLSTGEPRRTKGIISRLTEGAKRGVEDMRLLGGVLFVLILVAISVELMRPLS